MKGAMPGRVWLPSRLGPHLCHDPGMSEAIFWSPDFHAFDTAFTTCPCCLREIWAGGKLTDMKNDMVAVAAGAELALEGVVVYVDENSVLTASTYKGPGRLMDTLDWRAELANEGVVLLYNGDDKTVEITVRGLLVGDDGQRLKRVLVYGRKKVDVDAEWDTFTISEQTP